MRILYTSAEIHDAIKQVLRSSGRGSDPRAVFVAFVGADAEAFLPSVSGLEIVCCLQPGATSAPALQRLKQRGAKLFHAPGLHMKVYWSERRGAVICSANASRRALGRASLKEAGVWLPQGALDLDRLRRAVSARPVTGSDLAELAIESDKLAALIGRRRPSLATPAFTYDEWYQMSGRHPWKLGWWTEDGEVATSTVERTKSMYGRSGPADFIGAAKGRIHPGDWLLCFKLPSGKEAAWMYVDFLVRVPRSDKGAYESDYPYQAVQVHNPIRYPAPPFKLDRRFREALASVAVKYGENAITRIGSLVPPPRLLASIAARMGVRVA